MKLLLAVGLICVVTLGMSAIPSAAVDQDEQSLLQADRTAFGSGTTSVTLNDGILDPNFTWTSSNGNTLNKSEILQTLSSGKGFPREFGSEGGIAAREPTTTTAHTYGRLGVVQEKRGKLYVLRVWDKRGASWQLLIYQAVETGAPASGVQGNGACENPCNTVPFRPRSEDEREVIQAYQAVERAVAAHDSAAWSAHIADEFFAVTSNSDRPIDKATRMAGLDNQKVAGIAQFPLVAARMFEFGGSMVMTSVQQPERGLALRVTRVWFKRNGAWLEAYSYQTTIEAAVSIR
jgi:uncharacterized protein DUF4440